jgi:sodium-dependent dicarboxylate transporter 2/3/5
MKIFEILNYRRQIGLYLGLLSFVYLIIFPISPNNYAASMMAAVSSLMVVWWISEALPLGATSLVPIVAMPFLGIIGADDVAREYFNNTIMIFLGGFLVALSMQKWHLHKRISLIIIKILGTSNSGIILGFMVASAIISMFISNIATTVMLLPIGLAFIYELEEDFPKEIVHPMAVSIMLGIAYSSSIGGIATLVGTAPNLIFQRVFEISFPELDKISFVDWLMFGMPISITMLILTWLLFTKFLFKVDKKLKINLDIIKNQLTDLGKITYEEKCVLSIFLFTVFLWLFRSPINLEFIVIPGWKNLFANKDLIEDGTIAIFSGLLMFIIPSKNLRDNYNREKLLEIDVLSKIPWEVILIFGGGFALAKGFSNSGLSLIIGENFNNLQDLPPTLMTGAICFALTFLTELTSNTATTNAILPILASVAKVNNINPLILMLPATISASFAFMLPVGTPPNAIVYGSGRIQIREMIVAGLILNIIGVIVVTGFFVLINGI